MQPHRQTTKGQFGVQQMFGRFCSILSSSRRKLATAGVCALVIFLAFHVIFGANGMVVYTNKRVEYQKLLKETQALDADNQRLTKEVNDLKTNPKAIEKEAREQLGYVKKGEIVYVQPDQKPANHPAVDASAQAVKPQNRP